MKKAKTVVLWVLQVLLALLFLAAALPKLTSAVAMVERFQRWGYPDNFYLLVGSVEVLGAIALLIPRVTSYGAAALILVMIGASVTHLLNAEAPRVAFTGIVMILLALVAYARRPGSSRSNFWGASRTSRLHTGTWNGTSDRDGRRRARSRCRAA